MFIGLPSEKQAKKINLNFIPLFFKFMPVLLSVSEKEFGRKLG